MSDTLLSRFLRYVQIDTQSDDASKTCPSTPGQLVLLEMLKQELSELGAADVQMTRHGYVVASIPAKRKARVPTVAFLAHVDTAPDCSGKNLKPIVHRKYDGRVMKFPDKPGLTLDPATSPELRTAMGKDIVTASGTTLLGSDDKSGVAVIMTLVERLLRETKRKHGLIRVCFTPDEEIGRGVDKLDLRMLGADVAYTLDGGPPGKICWETFSGDAAEVIIDLGQARTAVGLATESKLLPDALTQTNVLQLAWSRATTPLDPRVITTTRNQKRFAQPC